MLHHHPTLGIGAVDERLDEARQLAKHYQLALVTRSSPPPDYLLYLDVHALQLEKPAGQEKPVSVDFSSGKNNHRRLYGGGRGQHLAKAVGLNKFRELDVIDATAGLARDAFVLATLGCRVRMLERSLPVFLLVKDAMLRAARADDAALLVIMQRMSLEHTPAHDKLQSLKPGNYPDIIYLDPMFPTRKKSARVQKEMTIFHDLIGMDSDSNELLHMARQVATKRIVVKRPRLSPFLADKKPAFQITGKSTRYDIYLPAA